MADDKLVWFKDILSDLEPKELGLDGKLNIHYIEYHNKSGKYMVERDFKNKNFWTSYTGIWLVLKNKYKMDREQIQDFLIPILNNHFKTKGYTITY